MSSSFPSVLTSYTSPAATDRLNNPSHSGIETNQNSGLAALETFVGTLSSVQGTLMYDIRAAASNGGGHVQTAALGGTGQTVFTKGDLLVAQSSSVLTKLGVGTNTQALIADSTQSTGVKWGSPGKFGGTGADSALSISSGTTTIDCANAAVVVKNYPSISITGTAKLAFSNPHASGTLVILRSQGAVTITSSTVPAIDASGLGAATDTNANSNFAIKVNAGATGQSDATPQTAAAGGTLLGFFNVNTMALIACGGGGGTAGTSTGSNFTSSGGGGASIITSGGAGTSANHAAGTGGAGGRGGGGLYIECGGAYNCTATLSVAGLIGGTGTGANGDGGGGGGGGTIVVRYASLTADSGTYTVSGGAAGPKAGTGNVGGVGGTGQSSISANTFFN